MAQRATDFRGKRHTNSTKQLPKQQKAIVSKFSLGMEPETVEQRTSKISYKDQNDNDVYAAQAASSVGTTVDTAQSKQGAERKSECEESLLDVISSGKFGESVPKFTRNENSVLPQVEVYSRGDCKGSQLEVTRSGDCGVTQQTVQNSGNCRGLEQEAKNAGDCLLVADNGTGGEDKAEGKTKVDRDAAAQSSLGQACKSGSDIAVDAFPASKGNKHQDASCSLCRGLATSECSSGDTFVNEKQAEELTGIHNRATRVTSKNDTTGEAGASITKSSSSAVLDKEVQAKEKNLKTETKTEAKADTGSKDKEPQSSRKHMSTQTAETRVKEKHTSVYTDVGTLQCLSERLAIMAQRSVIQFESFCLAMPMSKRKMAAFRKNVSEMVKLVKDIDKITVLNKAYHSEVLIKQKKVVDETLKVLKKRNNEEMIAAYPNSELITWERRFEHWNARDVEHYMLHSTFWVLSVDDRVLKAKWEGQFVATVNPLSSKLSISLFKFKPEFPDDIEEALSQKIISKKAGSYLVYNHLRFEGSAQLRMDVDLKSVGQLYLHCPEGVDGVGILILEVAMKPKFYRRWLQTNGEDRDMWKEQGSFLSSNQKLEAPICICLGGLVSELKELLFLILVRPGRPEVSLKGVYQTGMLACPGHNSLLAVYNNGIQKQFKRSPKPEPPEDPDDVIFINLDYIDPKVQKRRQKILNILRGYDLITVEDAVHAKYHKEDMSDGTRCKTNNFLGDLDLPVCLLDYVNFNCTDPAELEKLLRTPLEDSKYCLNVLDYLDLDSDDEDMDTDNMTAAELIQRKPDDQLFFSFCDGHAHDTCNTSHCERCHLCVNWHHWHCFHCDRCTYGQSIPICEYCGCTQEGEIVIKPESLYKEEEMNMLEMGMLGGYYEPNPAWVYDTSIDKKDMMWEEDPAEEDKEEEIQGQPFRYDSQAAMTCELGLLNPFRFVTGTQPSVRPTVQYLRKGQTKWMYAQKQEGQRDLLKLLPGPVEGEEQLDRDRCRLQ